MCHQVLLYTAAGRILVEGIDYSVNYQLGRVQILDPALQASTPIEVSLEKIQFWFTNQKIYSQCRA
jgi:cell surface protein SprA